MKAIHQRYTLILVTDELSPVRRMQVSRNGIRRVVGTAIALTVLIAVGLVASRLLPLEYFPAVDVPFIGIEIPYQGSTPEEVEREITRPVEEVIATLAGIKRLESKSSSTGA